MLQDIAELPNETDSQQALLFDLWVRGVIAFDAETGAELHVSAARRRLLRPKHYYVFAPNGKTYLQHLKGGWIRLKHTSKVFGVSAYMYSEAIAKANAAFAKKFARFMETGYQQDTLEDIERQIKAFATEQVQKQLDPHWHKKAMPDVLLCHQRKEQLPSEGNPSVRWEVHLRYGMKNVVTVVDDNGKQVTLVNCEETV